MNEYALLLVSALVSAAVNLIGLVRSGPPRRILVVKLDHLGDVITATPALRALREAHPDAAIDLLLSSATGPLFAESPLANGVLAYDSTRYRRGEPASAGPILPKGARYDTVIELRGDRRTLTLPFRVRAARRFDRGSVRLREWWARRLGRGTILHEVETNLAVVRPMLGSRATSPPLEVHVPPAAETALSRRLNDAGVSEGQPVVTLHPGAAWRPRAWRADRFAAIADWVGANYDAQVIAIGGAEEADVEAALRSHARARVIFLFGSLSITEVAALLRRSRLLIGNDSGLAHLAAACGTPVISLFGPQDPARFRPWAPPERGIVLHHRVPCFPCAQDRCVRPELPCVNLIEIGEVQAAVRSLLGPPAGS